MGSLETAVLLSLRYGCPSRAAHMNPLSKLQAWTWGTSVAADGVNDVWRCCHDVLTLHSAEPSKTLPEDGMLG